MGLITIGGLGSGLDVSSIIDALVSAERAPTQSRLDRFETDVTVELTGIGGLKSALDELRSSALGLSLDSTFSKRTTSVSDDSFFTASATNSATPGEYNIEVTALAQGSVDQSKIFTGGASTTFGDGTLTFTVGSDTFNVDVSATDTLEDIRSNINSAVNNDFISVNLLNNVTDGVDTGSVLNFNSSITGTGNDLVVTFSGDASLADLSDNLTQTQAAGDASIEIDGLTATSTSNTFTDVVQDITIDISKVHSAGVTDSLTVALDTDSVKNSVNGFVAAFNAFVDVTKELGSADLNSPGLLVGDFTLRQSESQIRSLFSSSVDSINGDYNRLSAIGVTTTEQGYLEVDSEKLDDALAAGFEDFDELFAGEQGFATRLRDLIDKYTGSNGSIISRQESLNEQLSKIDSDRIELAARIESLTTRLTRQFSAMDAAVAQFNSTQSFLATQLANYPGAPNKDK